VITPDEAKAILIRKARRSVLVTLKLLAPIAVTFSDLCHAMPLAEPEHLGIDLHYLQSKSYVVRVNARPNQRRDDQEYMITHTGLEVVDRITVDPALEP